jgi:hypothetical protein
MSREAFIPVITHFSRMEALGVSLKGLPKPHYTISSQDIAAKNFKKIFSEIRTCAFNHYSTLPELSEQAIRNRISEMRKRTAPEFISAGLFDRHFNIPEPGLAKYRLELLDLLAVEFLHSYDFKTEIRGDAHDFLLLGLVAERLEERNVALSRALKSVWDFRDKSAESKRYSPQEISEFEEAMRIKQFRDMVDFELLHFALFGYFEAGTSYPVMCVTADSPLTLSRRIRVFKGLLQVTRARFQVFGARALPENNGIIYTYNRNPDERYIVPVPQLQPF